MKRTRGDVAEDRDKETFTTLKRRRSRSLGPSDEVVQFDEGLFPPRKRPPPTGHELDRINDHITLEHFGTRLQKAVNTIFPGDGKKGSRYTRVDVLLLSWEDEDPKLPVSLEVDELASTFAGLYGYNVEKWSIPSDECHIRLQGKVLRFLGNNDSAHLKIVYYAGHGRLTNHGQPAWTSLQNKGKERCPTIKWSGIQNTLEESRSDVLILLDCCASGVCTSDEGNGVTELIAACAYNAVANGVGRYSFTHALNSKLRQLSQLPCFNIGYLYNAIFSEVQSWKVEDARFLKAPVHLVLSQNHDLPRSICLSKTMLPEDSVLGKAPLSNSPLETMQAGDMDSSSQDIHPKFSSPTNVPSNTGCSPSSEGSDSSQLTSLNTSLSQLSEYPRLLFSIHLSEDVKPCDLSSDLFTDWLRSIPASARLVTVEAGFASTSTITLVSVPAALLAYLAPDPAILLLGTIWSRNLVSEFEVEETTVPAPNTSSKNIRRTQAQGISTGIPLMATGIQSPMLRTKSETSTFSDAEKRFVLAEAIKTSRIPVNKLFTILNEYNIIPNWKQMLLPVGRNLSQCIEAFELHSRSPGQPQNIQPYPQSFHNTVPRGTRETIPPSRLISPKPAHNFLPEITAFQGAQMLTPDTSPAAMVQTTAQRKRGRPSKAEVERRQREAIERGDIIPPPPVQTLPEGQPGQNYYIPDSLPAVILPGPSLWSPAAVAPPGHMPSPHIGVEAPGKKRKPRPPPKPKVQKPGEHQFSINPPIGQIGGPANAFAPETAQAGPIAAGKGAGNLVASQEPAPAPEPTPEPQPNPNDT
ncbi:hypothetical protein L207DRAFT_286342 [Hyaloscypha variabilis F]|uniref:Uncharacterized protein n=1 Tax=Hyaloscypha variabilis (strain UAMH 11265 / GT02V1 / F) TaxID=1149755 RepID=A0A2J6S1Y1_HYAVF|nr:hypothetical protein L207DRAFT_286342 [Hyaloscypha variabilis F]